MPVFGSAAAARRDAEEAAARLEMRRERLRRLLGQEREALAAELRQRGGMRSLELRDGPGESGRKVRGRPGRAGPASRGSAGEGPLPCFSCTSGACWSWHRLVPRAPVRVWDAERSRILT